MKLTHSASLRGLCIVVASTCAFALSGAEAVALASSDAYEVSDAPGACGEAASDDFNMRITFSLLSGACVPQVHLSVQDQSGAVVLDLVSHGAPVHARVPPGTYEVTARYGTQQSVQRFTIGALERSLAHFSWPASTESDNQPAPSHKGETHMP
jgi:hypothetical protein